MQQRDVDRVQEFRKCIECFLCQDVCHVLRDHDKHEEFIGPRFFVYSAALEMHPLDTDDRLADLKDKNNIGYCNITKCCTKVCPEHIHITDNAIIPLKERVVDRFYDPVTRLLRMVTGSRRAVFELKRLSTSAIPAALAKAERYRLLNEPEEAQSICEDVLAADPVNFDAVRMFDPRADRHLPEPRRQQRQPRAGAGGAAAVGIRARLLRAAWWRSAAPARCCRAAVPAARCRRAISCAKRCASSSVPKR